MKRLIILLLLLLFPTLSFSQGIGPLGGVTVVVGEPACAWATKDTSAGTNTALFLGFSDTNSNHHGAQSWTSGSEYTLKRFTVHLKKVGDPNAAGLTTITAKVCTAGSGVPSATCTTADATLATSVLTTSYADYTFNITAGYSISNETRYYVKLLINALGDTSNYVLWQCDNAGTEILSRSTDDSTWASPDTSATASIVTEACE